MSFFFFFFSEEDYFLFSGTLLTVSVYKRELGLLGENTLCLVQTAYKALNSKSIGLSCTDLSPNNSRMLNGDVHFCHSLFLFPDILS